MAARISLSSVLALALFGCNDINLHPIGEQPTQPTGSTTAPAARGEIAVSLGEDRLVSVAELLSLSAVVSGDVEDRELVFTWSQRAGLPLDLATAGAVLAVDAPDEVTTLILSVKVSAADDARTVATDEIAVLVAADAVQARFVDADHGDDAADGSWDRPWGTLDHGLASAAEAGLDLYLNNPDNGGAFAADEALVLPDGVALYGGFDTEWIRSAGVDPTRIVATAATALEAWDHQEPIVLSGLDLKAELWPDGELDSTALWVAGAPSVTLDRVRARGSDLATDPTRDAVGFHAGSSYGARVEQVAELTVVGSTLVGGQGASGPDGLDGAAGARGADGADGSWVTGGAGGSSGHNGASGGRGGDAVAIVDCYGGSAGSWGFAGVDAGGAAPGVAGTAWYGFPDVWNCYGTAGGNGATVGTSARAGSAGSAASAPVDLSSGWYSATNGVAGSNGYGGSGGGGGGSGPGAGFVAGGGGGGGAEGGEGGRGAQAGAGGGGSFGLVLLGVDESWLTDSVIEASSGGAGSAGGNGGSGGYGGSGGWGAETGVRSGGDGGNGGRGGRGGDGGGGAGGSVAGLVAVGGVVTLDDVVLRTAAAGSGTGARPGQGGWNHGAVLEGAELVQTSVSWELGEAGNDNVASEVR